MAREGRSRGRTLALALMLASLVLAVARDGGPTEGQGEQEDDYRQDFTRWVYPAMGEVAVDRLRRSQVQALVDDVAAASSGQRARNVATALRALYRYLLPRHDDLVDPTHGISLPAGSPRRDVIVTPDEMLGLAAALDGQGRVAFALAGMAGLRAGEVKALQVGDVAGDAIIVRAG